MLNGKCHLSLVSEYIGTHLQSTNNVKHVQYLLVIEISCYQYLGKSSNMFDHSKAILLQSIGVLKQIESYFQDSMDDVDP